MSRERLIGLGLLLLGGAVAVLLAADIAMLFVQVSRSPNEGWNAYHALDAMTGGALYPLPPSLLYNNYPPLSYFLTGPLGQALGDHIAAGRIVSLLASCGVALALARAARLLGCGPCESLLAALLFLASPWVLTKIGGIDDPQLLGNFLGALGLVVVLRGPARLGHVALGALLFAAALFVKLLYVALPLMLCVWLWRGHRASALLLAGLCAAFGVAGIALSDHLLHIELIHHVLSARVFLPGQMFAHPGQWLVTGALPLAATLSLFARARGDDGAYLAALYAAIALPLALFFSGGEGVSAGPTFELSMATALGGAVWLSRAPWRPRLFAAAIALMLVQAALSFFGAWSSSPSSLQVFAQRAQADAAIARIRAEPGPVLCEMLALCYWAGKPAEVDAFGLAEAFKRRTRDEGELIARLDAHAWTLVQLTPRSSFGYSPAIMAAIARNYRPVADDTQGRWYRPR